MYRYDYDFGDGYFLTTKGFNLKLITPSLLKSTELIFLILARKLFFVNT